MMELDSRVEALSAAPAGCAFLLVVERSGLTPQEAARPVVSVHAAAIALREINVWGATHDRVVPAVLAEGPRLAFLARAILLRPEAAWWFEPVDRSNQIWLSRDGGPPGPSRIVTPATPPSDWERYAQKPFGALYTSTGVDDTTSFLAGALHYAGDLGLAAGEPPLVRYRLEASAEARVYEVDGPDAWHQLCARYPARYQGQLVPGWSAVARDWDAVHLGLGGLLTAEQVAVASAAGSTTHWGWDAEQTVWLRWCFDAVHRLPDLPTNPEPPLHLEFPSGLGLLEGFFG